MLAGLSHNGMSTYKFSFYEEIYPLKTHGLYCNLGKREDEYGIGGLVVLSLYAPVLRSHRSSHMPSLALC